MKNEKSKEKPVLLMSRERIKRSLSRMAYQVAEDNREALPILILGIKERGFAVAQSLTEYLSSVSENEVILSQLSLKNKNKSEFADLDILSPQKSFEYILLVDDVIFSGQTMLSAIQTILRQWNPLFLRTAVLVDRGHRTVPVEATFTGLNLPTKLDEHVSVKIKNNFPQKIFLINKPG